MNLVGKIFTTLILVFSLVFASFAVSVYSTHKNWKEEAESRKKDLDAQVAKNTKLNEDIKKERSDWEAVKAASTEALAKAETERNELKTERDQLADQKKTLDKQLADATTDVATSNEELKALRGEVEKIRGDIVQAQKDVDVQFKDVVRLTDELNQKANEVIRLKELQKDLAEQYAKAKEVLMMFKLPADPAAVANVPPVVEGLVTAVAGDGLIEISIGADDGIRKGHQLEIYRLNGTSNTYVGRVEVQRTAPDRAVCKTIPSYMKSQIQKGDRVASKLQ